MRIARLGWVGAWVLCSVSAVAIEDQPDFSADRFLIGRWSCDANQEGRKPAREDAAYSWGLDGRWLKVSYTVYPSEPDLRPTITEAYETFDASRKKWVYVSLSSNGSYGTSYSDGWKGDVKVYRPADADPQQFRFIATRVSDREFTEVAEVPSTGEWRAAFSLRCRRVD
jgi:hypothetical protein